MSDTHILLLVISLAFILFIVVPLTWLLITIKSFERLENEIKEALISLNSALITFYEVFMKTFKDCQSKLNLNGELLIEVNNFECIKLDDEFSVKQQFVYDFLKLIVKVQTFIETNENILNDPLYLECLDKTKKELETLHASRRVYNAIVSYFNQKRVTFPDNIVAKLKKLKNYPFFETELL